MLIMLLTLFNDGKLKLNRNSIKCTDHYKTKARDVRLDIIATSILLYLHFSTNITVLPDLSSYTTNISTSSSIFLIQPISLYFQIYCLIQLISLYYHIYLPYSANITLLSDISPLFS